jgi:hypothetical protein
VLKDKTMMQQAQLVKMKKNLEIPAPATSKLKGNDKQNPFLILDPEPDTFLAVADTVGVKLHQKADSLVPTSNSSCPSIPAKSYNPVIVSHNLVTASSVTSANDAVGPDIVSLHSAITSADSVSCSFTLSPIKDVRVKKELVLFAQNAEVISASPPSTPIHLQDEGDLDEDDFAKWTTIGKHRRGKHPRKIQFK